MRKTRTHPGRRRAITGMTAAALVLAMTVTGAAAQDPGGDHGGPGGGSGEPDVVGSDYGDLSIILRDVNGLPELAEFTIVDEETSEPTVEQCVQPISYTALPSAGGVTPAYVTNEVDGHGVWLIPLQGETLSGPTALAEDDTEIEVCDPLPNYAYYVREADLERLNYARTSDEVKDNKLEEVANRLLQTPVDAITLDAAGRLTTAGTVIDAAPEQAAIHEELLETGTVPNLPDATGTRSAPPAFVAPLGAWELSAAAMGAAGGKYVPITIDAVSYYNRITTVAEDATGWGIEFLTGWNGRRDEEFVDYRTFSYDRAATFPGCMTWLNVPTLTWEVGKVADLADFADLPPNAYDTDADGLVDTLDNIAGFAQLADDARAVIALIHEHEVIAGFYADPLGIDTCSDQALALVNPAVHWDDVPAQLIQTRTTQISASAYNPWKGAEDLNQVALRVTVDAPEPFTADTQVAAVATDGAGAIPFTVEGGDLVGRWGPAGGFEMDPGYAATTTFDVTVAADAPLGVYTVTLELVDLSGGDLLTAPTLAEHVVTTAVTDDVLTVMWDAVAGLMTQTAYNPITATVFNPMTGTAVDPATLELTIDAAEDFTAANQAVAYSDAVGMTFAVVAGNLVGSWDLGALALGHDAPITWYLQIASGAPTGVYALTLAVTDGTDVLATSAAAETVVMPYVSEGNEPEDPGPGDDHGGPPDDDDGSGPPDDDGGSGPPDGTGGPGRVGGRDRIETAVLTSQIAFPDGADVALIARSDLYPDALAGVPLAGMAAGPILLTHSADLDAAVAAELTRLGASRVILLGGERALSSDVAAALVAQGIPSVERIAGIDRFETAARIASLLPGDNVYVVEGANPDPARGWPDALAVGPLAALDLSPILLVESGWLPDATAAALAARPAASVATVVGGTAAVSDAVLAAVDGIVPVVARVGGLDRYETSLKLADLTVVAGGDPTTLFVATGQAFPDALSAGAAAAAGRGVLLLVNGLHSAGAAPYWIAATADGPVQLAVVGGTSAISEPVMAALVAACDGTVG